MGENNEYGKAADGIKLWNFLSHGRRQRLNARSQFNAELLAYVSTVRGEKGQLHREEARLERQGS